MNETNRTNPNLVAKIQVSISNKTQNSNYFSFLRKSGSYKNMRYFMAILYFYEWKHLVFHSLIIIQFVGIKLGQRYRGYLLFSGGYQIYFIECGEKIQYFSRVRSTSENADIFTTRDEIYLVFAVKK